MLMATEKRPCTAASDAGVDIDDPRTWRDHAARLLVQALEEVRDGTYDPIPAVSAALAVLQVEAGELPAEEVDVILGGPDERPCVCPPDLIARGGFRGDCPVHA